MSINSYIYGKGKTFAVVERRVSHTVADRHTASTTHPTPPPPQHQATERFTLTPSKTIRSTDKQCGTYSDSPHP
ncbi:hypothetical protein J6590_025240 [Homalodisca vitripennis]|nr:hypothetical protein J6590_025240 [Homalodisca vitripennis]